MLNRRKALRMGAAATAGYALASRAWAQSAQAKKLKLDAYSRTLHWLRKPEEVAQACHEIGNTTIDLTVRVYPGHVDPERVRTDLPPFAKTLRENGIVVTTMAAEITDANTPNAEAMLDTASSLGIHHHWWRGFTVDLSMPYPKQIESLKPRVAGLAKLNEKYGMKAMYHPGGGGVSGAFVDLLDLVRNFDPRYISIQCTTRGISSRQTSRFWRSRSALVVRRSVVSSSRTSFSKRALRKRRREMVPLDVEADASVRPTAGVRARFPLAPVFSTCH